MSGPADLSNRYLNRGVRINKEKDKRQKIESGGLSVNTAEARNLFLKAFLYTKQWGKKTSLPWFKEQTSVNTSCYSVTRSKASGNQAFGQTSCYSVLRGKDKLELSDLK